MKEIHFSVRFKPMGKWIEDARLYFFGGMSYLNQDILNPQFTQPIIDIDEWVHHIPGIDNK